MVRFESSKFMRPTISRISRIDLPKRLVSGQEFHSYLADFVSRQKKGKYGGRELDDYRPIIQLIIIKDFG